MKEIGGNKWKDTLASQRKRINIAKTFTVPNVIYSFNVADIKITVLFLQKLRKIKFTRKHIHTIQDNHKWGKKGQSRGRQFT